ncbi:MAG TPA: Crp/Fnr family transcriptional regulator [Nostocaceae cyanobacterium]|nr:Crp/Fnr family transcriptional regulator [Nostocaceae cyanobacterium]
MPVYTGIIQPATQNIHQHFARRSHLPENKNILWQIERGFVKTVTYLEDGTSIALGLWGPGDVVGQGLSKIEPYHLECLTPVETSIIPWEEGSKQTELLLNHIQQAEELMVIRSHKKVETMLIKLLAWLSKKFGSEVESGKLIDMRLTHEDLAELVCSTRVTVTRIMGEIEQEGLINRLPLNRIIVREEEIWYYEI